MTTKIIGLGHKARHGKDTVAGCLLKRLPGSRVFSFADDLKALARALGMTEKNGPFLQKLGEAMRTLDVDYWVKRLALRIDESNAPYVMIPDVRFPNELEWVHARGGIAVKVERFEWDGALYVDSSRDPLHYSETALDGCTAWDEQVTAVSGNLWVLDAAAKRIADKVR